MYYPPMCYEIAILDKIWQPFLSNHLLYLYVEVHCRIFKIVNKYFMFQAYYHSKTLNSDIKLTISDITLKMLKLGRL